MYEITKRNRVWTAVCKGICLATEERTDLGRGANDDIMVTEIERRRKTMTRIIIVYDQRDVQTAESQARKLNWHSAIRHGGGTIITGNMKAHS